VLDREKPELLRYDTEKNSRIKVSLEFTKDRKSSFPSQFQFVFFRPINRMFVIGGSNNPTPKVEKWIVMQRAGAGAAVFEEFLLNTSMTGWEILTDHWKVIRKFALGLPRYAHTSIGIENNYIYSIGGKDEKASTIVERYELDGNSEVHCELNFPRYYASACTFDEKYIYVYGGYDNTTKQILNKIERIDHLNPEVTPSLYELDVNDLPCLTGSLLSQYNENSILILGGRNRKFNSNAYYFDCQELAVKCCSLRSKNPNKKNLFAYQSDYTIIENDHGNDRFVFYIDSLLDEYTLKSLVL